MSATKPTAGDPDFVWNRYRHNFSRHLLGVALYFQNSLMNVLREQRGHTALRLGFAPYIMLLGEESRRLTELADCLGISRQACNQAVKQIAAAGYIESTADPADGRARQLSLSARGRQLRRDGARIVAELDRAFAAIVGADRFADASKSLGRISLHPSLGLATQPLGAAGTVMGGWLPRLSDYIMQRLMELTRARGHSGLKLSFGQVLTLIGPDGGRIQQMAAAHDVSKQAISAIATELEELGYLQRQPDPLDARQVVLQFTDRGRQLIADSVAGVDQLEDEFAGLIGRAALKRMNETLYALYRGLQLEQDIFEHRGAVDLSLLARQLQLQLGDHDSRALARLLLDATATER